MFFSCVVKNARTNQDKIEQPDQEKLELKPISKISATRSMPYNFFTFSSQVHIVSV